jgi:hypothetical protein
MGGFGLIVLEAALALVLCAALVAATSVWWFRQEPEQAPASENKRGGWIYFTGTEEGPVRLNVSKQEPAEVLYKVWAENRVAGERNMREFLKEERVHGGYDRDIILAYIDHWKEAV